ncbi:alpha/beta fold hydrolase [Chryseobacterium sp.]|uniref:alpha/beta fold hydrolase n=1 Tax=Chryseobacterium sp. TaxID=1871047 RepID=UPI00388DE0F8
MKTELKTFILSYTTYSNKEYQIPLSYQLFGKRLFSAPIIMVNHALTGNSDVAGEKGWWKTLVGNQKTIDTSQFTIICFNIPGNGYDGVLLDRYEDFSIRDIAQLFLNGLKYLNIHKLYALIGGSIGGSIGWQMMALEKNLAEKFIPIATNYKTTDWMYAQCIIQKCLLESTHQPLEKARMHAMLCYRTPESINSRFKREKDEMQQQLQSQNWLEYHGKELNDRFSLEAYWLVNHLLTTMSVTEEEISSINANISIVSIDTDLFYPASENQLTFELLKNKNKNVRHFVISSIHGHDAFLMEYKQLNMIINTIFDHEK